MRKATAEALVKFPRLRAQSITHLVEALGDQEPQVVRAAIISLGRLGKGSAQAREAVARFANDPDQATRETAAVAMANINPVDGSTVPLLVKALGSSEDTLAKLAVAAVLGADASTVGKALPALMENLQSGQEPLFTNTLSALRLMSKHFDEILPRLVRVYEKTEPEKRPQILQALSAMDRNGSQSAQVLAMALKDPDAATRKQALISVARSKQSGDHLGPVLPEALNDPDASVRVQALDIIRTRADTIKEAFQLVMTAAQDKDSKVRVAALETLTAFTNPPQDRLQILERIASDEKDPAVRATAFAALANTSASKADIVIPFLEKALEKEQDAKVKDFLSSTLTGVRRRAALHSDTIVPGEELGK